MSNNEEKTCCICGKQFIGWGNNPYPIDMREDAICCDDCNIERVVPARIFGLGGVKHGTK